MRIARPAGLLVALACVCATAACSAGTAAPGPTSAPGAATGAATGSATPTPAPATGPATAADVRAAGTRVSADLWVAGGRVTASTTADGGTRFTVRPSPGPVLLAAGHGRTFVVQDDGSVIVRGATAPVEALAPPRADGDGDARPVAEGDLLTVGTGAPSAPLHLWLATDTVRSATWGRAEGGRSLAVDPSAWARAGSAAARALLWAQLVAARPDADSHSMHDQLLCHMLGAPTKATWNLEPWRPEVDALTMIADRCNPT